MKKVLGIILTLICILALTACGRNTTGGHLIPDMLDFGDVEKINFYYFEGQVEEIYENSIKVVVLENNGSVISSDLAVVTTKDILMDFNIQLGDIVGITFEGGVAESYPVQIKGTVSIDLIRSYASLYEYEEVDGKINYQGVWYNQDKLSEATLNWLKSSPTDKMLSSYYPPEFVEGANFGLEMRVENVTPTGLVFICNHSTERELTDIYQLQTGSYYSLEVLQDSEYVLLEHSVENLAWTAEAWLMFKDADNVWSLNWEWLYGVLPAGQYRVGKEIMNFKETGVYDKIMVYGYFTIS